nr:WAP four-disulfide core domain protein 3-like [Paramormyrops kingsleyae]
MRVFLAVIVMAEWLFALVFGFQEIFCMIGKPGTCPRSMGELPSKSFCTCDNECPGKMKCCAFNFSYCDLPALGKPVPCRITKAGDTICTANKDCPKGWKCCSNGCGHLCAPPATGK